MISKKKMAEAVHEAYVRLFRCANPSGNFDELVSSAPTGKNGEKVVDYMKYEIIPSEFDRIVDGLAKKYKMTKLEHQNYRITLLIGCSPKFKI